MTSKKLVISNYRATLDWITKTHDYGITPENTIIYSKECDDERDWSHLGTEIKVPNMGANQYDILKYIIDNYDNLPDVTIFFKGNLFNPIEGNYQISKDKPSEYYTNESRFVQTLESKTYFSTWSNPNRYRDCKDTPKEMLDNGLMQQPLNHCDFSSNIYLEHRYFTHPHQVLDWCFVNPPKGSMITFLPSSNMALPKENILRYSKNLYEKLISIISYIPADSYYDNIPAECHLLERIFYTIWSNELEERGEV